MNRLKRLPVGYEDFGEIIEKDFYYIDKTMLIEQILNQGSKVSLITRPRRFGKSLNMSMLKYFFKLDTDKTLFDGLYISNNKELCDKYMGKYPVISISLKNVESSDFVGAKKKIIELIKFETEKFYLSIERKTLNELDEERYEKILHMTIDDDDVLSSSLKNLSYLLYKYYNQKTIILIDEYDVPLDKAFQNGYYRELVSLIRGIFSEALKTNEYLEFAILTGCLRISKESIFTGLNNFKVFSITDSRFDEQFGFTSEEVIQMLKYYNLENKYDEIKKWYDGYRFGKAEIYCPWDVINHVGDLHFDPSASPKAFWLNSSGNGLVKRLIDKADNNTKNDIESLMEGETIEKRLNLELTYDELDKKIDNIWSVLFTTGYLTLADKPNDDIYKLRIPNYEIRKVYENQILDLFDDVVLDNKDKLSSLWSSINDGDNKTIEDTINDILSETISVLDPKGDEKEKEKYYHTFLSGLLVGNGQWRVHSNKESGSGFADIMLESKRTNKGLVIEIKSVDKITELDNACIGAIKQIHDRKYYDYLINEGKDDILLYGIAFYKKTCRVMVDTIKQI